MRRSDTDSSPRSEQQRKAVARWLEAERAGRDREAEGWYANAMGMLPLASPSAGFARRVLAAAAPPESRFGRLRQAAQASMAMRGLAVAMMLLVGLGVLVVPAALVRLARAIGPELAPGWMTEVLVAASAALAAGLAWLRGLITVRQALDTLLVDPAFMTLVGVLLALGFAALATLHGLLAAERGKRYVEL